MFSSVLQKKQKHGSYSRKEDASKPSKMAKLFTPVQGRSEAMTYHVVKIATVYLKAIIQGFLLDSSYMTLSKIYTICCI
jgi:hypothetical protein